MHKEVDNTEPWQEGLGVTHNDTQTDEAADGGSQPLLESWRRSRHRETASWFPIILLRAQIQPWPPLRSRLTSHLEEESLARFDERGPLYVHFGPQPRVNLAQ
jgi:hypothetical protein